MPKSPFSHPVNCALKQQTPATRILNFRQFPPTFCRFDAAQDFSSRRLSRLILFNRLHMLAAILANVIPHAGFFAFLAVPGQPEAAQSRNSSKQPGR